MVGTKAGGGGGQGLAQFGRWCGTMSMGRGFVFVFKGHQATYQACNALSGSALVFTACT